MRFLILLAFVGTCSALAIQQAPSGPPPTPPQTNPSINTEKHGQVRDPKEPIAVFDSSPSKQRAAATCDINAIIAASGDNLGALVRDAPRMCISEIFNLVDSQAKNACNEADVTKIANWFYGDAGAYDPAKPANTPGILNFVLYLRACYYVQSYNDKVVGNYSSNLLTVVRYGLDKFFQRPNLEAQNDYHYEIFRETISLISNAHDYLNYLPTLATLLTKLSSVWKFQNSVFIQKGTQHDVINSMYDIFFRSHYEEKPATDYYCKNTQVPQALSDFMDRKADLVGTTSQWLFQNTAGELGRFSKYACIYPTVSALLKKQLAKYNENSAPKVYAALMETWSYYDSKNCATYGFCNFKENLEKKVLPYSKTCDKTYMDTFKVRAQSISDAEAAEVCRRLKDQESYFHNLVKDNWKPVNPDTNALIEVVIFDNVDEYKFYAAKIFGISTDNGGMYIEGDPSKAGNVARYFCYERPTNGKFDVWNLEHEFTHYLDGRYDMQGDFTASSSSGHTIWWLEGFAEYAANKNQYPSMQQDCKDKSYPLSTIINNTYNSGQNRIYHYGYLVARFMFERHRSDVDTIMSNFRTGQYSSYENFIRGIGYRYDQEFSNWCDCIAKNQPC